MYTVTLENGNHTLSFTASNEPIHFSIDGYKVKIEMNKNTESNGDSQNHDAADGHYKNTASTNNKVVKMNAKRRMIKSEEDKVATVKSEAEPKTEAKKYKAITEAAKKIPNTTNKNKTNKSTSAGRGGRLSYYQKVTTDVDMGWNKPLNEEVLKTLNFVENKERTYLDMESSEKVALEVIKILANDDKVKICENKNAYKGVKSVYVRKAFENLNLEYDKGAYVLYAFFNYVLMVKLNIDPNQSNGKDTIDSYNLTANFINNRIKPAAKMYIEDYNKKKAA